MPDSSRLRVFISSVVGGLQSVRLAIRERLGSEFDVRNCENWPARPVRPWEACKEEVLSSDLLVFLVGDRYGARCPVKPEMSFSEAEYRTALEAGDPQVVAYRLTEQSSPTKDQPPEDLSLLERLRTEVRDTLFAPEVPESEVAAKVHAAVLDFIHREGYGGGAFSTFQRWDVRYRGELRGEGYFHHRHALVARAQDLDHLRAFVNSTAAVGVLVGGAGHGKSRLLIEFARSHAMAKQAPAIRFIAASPLPVAPDALAQLPTGPVLVVVDDAHARGSLASDIEALLSRRDGGVRLLLLTRPEGEEFVRAALRSLQVSRLPPLRPLENDGTALAIAILGAGRETEARRIATLSSGVPLFITVGCELLAEGSLALTDVVSDDEYRALVFERILRGPGPAPADDEMSVLAVLSAIGPIPADANASRLVASIGRIEPQKAAEGLSGAIDRGIVMKRGFQYSIVPDLLSDYVLRRACVTKKWIPTDFLDSLELDGASSDVLANVTRNALVVDYLERRAGRPLDLLGDRWRRLADGLRHEEPQAVRAAIDRLAPVARIAAGPLLEIARSIAPRVLNPTVEYPLSQLRTSLIQLLIECGQDQERSLETGRLLCTLASYETGQAAASSALEQLASYGRPPAYGRQNGIVTAVLEAHRKGVLLGDVVPKTLARALEREGEWAEFDRKEMRMGSFGISADATASTRDLARKGVLELALGPSPSLAAKAVDVLADLLGHWPGKFARVPSDGERASWVPEARQALDLLTQIASTAPLETTRALARRRIQERRRRGHGLIDIHRPSSLASCQLPAEVRVVDAMLEPIDDGIEGDKPWERAHLRHGRCSRWLTRALLASHGTAKDLVSYLEPIAARVVAMGVRESHVGVWPLMQALGEVAPALRLSVHEEICHVGGSLAGAVQQIVAEFLRRGEKSLARSALQAALSSTYPEVRHSGAMSLRWICEKAPADPEDVTLVSSVLGDRDLVVRRFAIGAIGPLAAGHLSSARRLLASVRTDGDWSLIDQLLDQVGDKDVPLTELSDSEVKALLEQIPVLRSLGVSSNTLHVSLFLKGVALARPAAFVDWVLSRVPSGPDAAWEDVHLNLEVLRRQIDPDEIDQAERSRLVDAILARLRDLPELESTGIRPMAVLLAWTSPSVQTAMPRVLGALVDADEERFGRVVRGLMEFGESLVFGAVSEMTALSELAERIGGRCVDILKSVALEAVSPGPVSVGERPIPAYDRIAKRAAECAASTTNIALRDLYREVEAFYREQSNRPDEDDWD